MDLRNLQTKELIDILLKYNQYYDSLIILDKGPDERKYCLEKITKVMAEIEARGEAAEENNEEQTAPPPPR